MFTNERSWGDHKIYTYDIEKHPFIQYFKNLYNEEQLDMLHLKSDDYIYLKNKQL